jgi:hypothetical protein
MKFTSSRQWVVAGLTSFGIDGCGLAKHSGTYTRVTSYADWINTTISAADVDNDPALHATDTLPGDETINSVFLEEFMINISSRYYSSPLLYSVAMISLSLCFL